MNHLDRTVIGTPASDPVLRSSSGNTGWDPDRAGIESAAHLLIGMVVAGFTKAIERAAADGDVKGVRALVRQRRASARMRGSVTGARIVDLQIMMESLRITLGLLREQLA